jgi:hypothetical protein
MNLKTTYVLEKTSGFLLFTFESGAVRHGLQEWIYQSLRVGLFNTSAHLTKLLWMPNCIPQLCNLNFTEYVLYMCISVYTVYTTNTDRYTHTV